MWSGGQLGQLGGGVTALGLEVEGVVEAAILTSEGGHNVHLPGLVAQADPPAGVRTTFWGDTRGGQEASGDHCESVRSGRPGSERTMVDSSREGEAIIDIDDSGHR